MSLKKKATAGLVWTYAQQFGNQLVGFLVSLVLARLLLPEEFGLIGMITVFLAIGNALLDGGLTASLIRSSDCDERDYSTVFFFQIIAGLLVYGIIYLTAPFIAAFYERPILIDILRVYSLSIVITAFSAVQMARLTQQMNFKSQALIALPAALVGGAVGILMAYYQYGVWSLVWSGLITTTVSSVHLWIYARWTPQLVFDIEKFKKHFNYGYKLTLSDFLNRIFNNIYLIVIGKFFSAAQVGFYTRAETMKQLPVSNISRALDKVTFPLFVSIKDDKIRLKKVYKKLLLMVIFIVAPILIFLAVLAEPIFRFLFTEKWLPAVPYFRILCAVGLMFPLHSYNLSILNVNGRSDLFLKIEIIKKVLITVVLIVTLPFGIMALLYGQVMISFLAFFINTHYTQRYIDYKGWQQIKDVFPSMALAIFSGLIIYLLDENFMVEGADIFRILVGLLAGIIIYLSLAFLLKFSSLKELYLLIPRK